MSGASGKTVEIVPLAQKKIAQRRMTMEGKERLLRVIYEETETTRVVVTAYLTSDIRRYWEDTT